MPDSNPRYAVLAIHWADRPERPEFLAVEGKIVLWDTLNLARHALPRLGGNGRGCYWNKAGDSASFLPFTRRGWNRLTIYTGYDPYDVPNGFRSKGVWSETHGQDWKHHVMEHEVIKALLVWADQENADADLVVHEDLALAGAVVRE